MLISIAIENFKSFNELTTFNMIASNKLRNNKERIYNTDNISMLKSAVIYGANASGKSNLIEAFQFIKYSVVSSVGIPLHAKQLFCKNNIENENKVTTFEIRMCIHDICYAYGFDVLLKDRSIESEWILQLNKSSKPKILFKRDKNEFTLDKSLKLDKMDKLKFKIYTDDLSENDSTLFLSEMNRNKKITKDSSLYFFKEIYNWFSEDLNILLPDTPITNFEYYYDSESLTKVKQLIKTFDTGITDIKIKNLTLEEFRNKLTPEIYSNVMNKIKDDMISNDADFIKLSMRSQEEFFNIAVSKESDEPIITTLSFRHGHSFFDFNFDEESDGTRRIFDLLDILLTQNTNSVYIIDEMERSLHPSLTRHFIELLNTYHKKNNVQLIFTTHESTIMDQDLFRRDQIWFVKRDNLNNSKLYPLDIFNERYDKKLSKAYLEGRYGAVPEFNDLNMEEFH